MKDYRADVIDHYVSSWGPPSAALTWEEGRFRELSRGFQVLEFAPRQARAMWTYATCCMSTCHMDKACELHLFSPLQDHRHVELLTIIAHYHQTGVRLYLGDSINFGRPWLPDSLCDHGLVSLPYLDGPRLEVLEWEHGSRVRFFWLIPITKHERDFKKLHGVEALEQRLEAANFDYLDASRDSVV